MTVEAAVFLDLQTIDSALDQIGHRRTRLPERAARDEAAAALAAQQARKADAERRAADAEATIERIEHEAAELTTRRLRLEAQLKTVIAPREAEALMHEIDTLNTARGELDDRELEALDVNADAEAQAASIAGELPAATEVVAEAQAALDLALAGLAGEEHDGAAARATVASRFSTAELERYERARAQFGGIAVAHLDGSRCDACHLDISRGELDEIRALPDDELGECPQCGRFLVR